MHHVPGPVWLQVLGWDLLSLAAGSAGGRVFPWAVVAADRVALRLVTVTGCCGRGSTQSRWLQGNHFISRKAKRNFSGRLVTPQVPAAGFLATALMHFIRWLIHAGCRTRVTPVCRSVMVALVYAPDPKICPVLTAHSLSTSPSEVLLVFNSTRERVGH